MLHRAFSFTPIQKRTTVLVIVVLCTFLYMVQTRARGKTRGYAPPSCGSQKEHEISTKWPIDPTPSSEQIAQLDKRGCSLRLVDKLSADKRSQQLLSGVWRDARIVFPFAVPVEGTVYWKVVPHPCSEPVTIEARMNGDGHGFESLYVALLRDVPKDKVVVDVGANMGAYSILPAVLGFNVVSVEIQADRVREIQLMGILNGVHDRLRVIHAAVAEETGAVLTCQDRRPENILVRDCTVLDADANVEHLEIRSSSLMHRMDDLLDKDSDVYLYKIDCDGCEPGWFKGSKHFLRTSGSSVTFYLIETGMQRWFYDFANMLQGNYLFCVLTQHGSYNPEQPNYGALVDAIRSKEIAKISEIVPTYLSAESIPVPTGDVDILLVNLDKL